VVFRNPRLFSGKFKGTGGGCWGGPYLIEENGGGRNLTVMQMEPEEAQRHVEGARDFRSQFRGHFSRREIVEPKTEGVISPTVKRQTWLKGPGKLRLLEGESDRGGRITSINNRRLGGEIPS